MIAFKTTSPARLLQEFKKAIDAGHVVTWKYYGDGDFTHTPNQWANLAYMRPSIGSGELRFNIVRTANRNVTGPVYAVYHGRLIESFMDHVDRLFDGATATALASVGDVIV